VAGKNQRIYRIHPAIGIARVGNADSDQFFIGPERPGRPASGDSRCGTTVPPYKADQGNEKIKPQAARFRVWEYVKNADGKYEAKREVDLNQYDVRRITWTVHLANRKASFHFFEGRKGDTAPPGPLRNSRWIERIGVGSIPMKASERKKLLDIDPGKRSIHGAKAKKVEFRADGTGNWPVHIPGHPKEGEYVIDYLGELRTDEAGRLIVIGGKGRAAGLLDESLPRSLIFAFNNFWWFDDVSDGPVSAELQIEIDGRLETIQAEGAWVIVGPPDFAPHVTNVVTLYDVLFDMAVWELDLPKDEAVYDGALKHLRLLNDELRVQGRSALEDFTVEFERDVTPVFQRARDYSWVTMTARNTHSSLGVGADNAAMLPLLRDSGSKGETLRDSVFSMLRAPKPFKDRFGRKVKLGGAKVKTKSKIRMPALYGHDIDVDEEDGLSLTRTQYLLLERWSRGWFATTSLPTPRITPHGLDQAALENVVGGAFYPGIEVSWLIRKPEVYSAPFRIDHTAKDPYWGKSASKIKPGHFTRQMALPWHSDFLECANTLNANSAFDGMTPDYFGWWPAQRPDHVKSEAIEAEDESQLTRKVRVDWFRPSGGDANSWPIQNDEDMEAELRFAMVNHWHKMGFVVRKGSQLIETERFKGNFP
jgi:hypothetical protein